MTARWLAASLLLLALGIGFGAVWFRGRILGPSLDSRAMRQLFTADCLWGLAAVLWLVALMIFAATAIARGVGM